MTPFQPGEFVRVSFHGISRRRVDKTKMRWIGSYIIDSIIGDDLYCLRDPLGGTLEARAARLIWYDDAEYQVTKEVEELFGQNYGRFEVNAITGLRKTNGSFLLTVQWRSFPEEDSTFEDLETLQQDVPGLVAQYLLENKDVDDLHREAYYRHFPGGRSQRVNHAFTTPPRDQNILATTPEEVRSEPVRAEK